MFFCVHPVFFVGEILSNLSIFFSNGWFIPTSYIVDDLPDLGEQLATNSQGEMDVDPVRKWKKQKKYEISSLRKITQMRVLQISSLRYFITFW